jgi:hypothetical protein
MTKIKLLTKALSHRMGEGRSRLHRDQGDLSVALAKVESQNQWRSQLQLGLLILLTGCLFSISTPVLSELPPAPSGTFSIAVIPDTPHYRGKGTKTQPDSDGPVTNVVFDAYTEWISSNLETQRIVFVSHVGDIVDKNVSEQWAVARNAMDRLHGKIPYGISVGNHDMTSDGNSSLFQEYFPASRFSANPWYAGSFTSQGDQAVSGNNANSYQLFSAGGSEFVFLHLECNAPDNVLEWASAILDQNENRVGFVTTHIGLGPLNKPTEGDGYFNGPNPMWDKCFRKHTNLRAVFCGDQSRTQSMYAAKQGDAGNLVHYFLSDYGSNGMRTYRFTPDADRLGIITYNPVKSALTDSTRIVPEVGRHQFTIRFDLQ